MGMDLCGTTHECLSEDFWHGCLDRAKEFGWKPEGTTLTMEGYPGDWDGSYYGNNYQLVSDRDARALGEALLRAVAALSARANAQERKVQLLANLAGAARKQWSKDPFYNDPLDDEICGLRRIADFALTGGFVIA